MKRKSSKKSAATVPTKLGDSYASTELTVPERDVLARVAAELLVEGYKVRGICSIYARAGYVVPDRTVRNWVVSVKSAGSALPGEYGGGAEPLLDKEMRMVVYGWAQTQIQAKIEVHLVNTKKFVRDTFGVSASYPTLSRVLNAGGFHQMTVKKKASGYNVHPREQAVMGLNFYRMARTRGLPAVPGEAQLGLIASIDFVSTAQGDNCRRAYGISGGAQPRSSITPPSFTNVIVTAIWADGIDRTPAAVYTHNPELSWTPQLTGSWKTKRKDDLNDLIDISNTYELDQTQVNYLQQDSNASKHYCAESAEILSHFVMMNLPAFKREGVIVFHDAGNAFFPGGISLFNTFGIDNVITYTPAIHHWLSPNDNNLHSYCKAIWRQHQEKYDNDQERTLYLLYLLKKVPSEHVRGWFAKNLMFGRRAVTKTDCEEFFRGDGKNLSSFHQECVFAYRLFFGLNGVTGQPLATADAESALDGRAYR